MNCAPAKEVIVQNTSAKSLVKQAKKTKQPKKRSDDAVKAERNRVLGERQTELNRMLTKGFITSEEHGQINLQIKRKEVDLTVYNAKLEAFNKLYGNSPEDRNKKNRAIKDAKKERAALKKKEREEKKQLKKEVKSEVVREEITSEKLTGKETKNAKAIRQIEKQRNEMFLQTRHCTKEDSEQVWGALVDFNYGDYLLECRLEQTPFMNLGLWDARNHTLEKLRKLVDEHGSKNQKKAFTRCLETKYTNIAARNGTDVNFTDATGIFMPIIRGIEPTPDPYVARVIFDISVPTGAFNTPTMHRYYMFVQIDKVSPTERCEVKSGERGDKTRILFSLGPYWNYCLNFSGRTAFLHVNHQDFEKLDFVITHENMFCDNIGCTFDIHDKTQTSSNLYRALTAFILIGFYFGSPVISHNLVSKYVKYMQLAEGFFEHVAAAYEFPG